MDNEKVLWSSCPSQVLNASVFIMFGLSILVYALNISFVIVSGSIAIWLSYSFMIVYGSMSIWGYLVVKNIRYTLTSETFLLEYGVINKDVDTLELYRVKDYKQSRPLLLRLFGLENNYLITSDRTNEIVEISAISRNEGFLLSIRDLVEKSRKEKGVREIDM